MAPATSCLARNVLMICPQFFAPIPTTKHDIQRHSMDTIGANYGTYGTQRHGVNCCEMAYLGLLKLVIRAIGRDRGRNAGYGRSASKRDKRNGTVGGVYTWEFAAPWGSLNAVARRGTAARSGHTSGRYGRGSETQSGEKSARGSRGCPSICPVTDDTRRHAAASDDRASGADRHVAMAPDTPRHVGLGLHNRRLQVRFLSHLPVNLEFMGISSLESQQSLCALTSI
jgi:hypothetical protein